MSYQGSGAQARSGEPPRPELRPRATGGPAGSVGSETSFVDVLGMLRRHVAMIVVLTLIIGLTGTALTLYLYRVHPIYRAEARISIDPGLGTRDVGGRIPLVQNQIQIPQVKNFINTQVRRILAPGTLDLALSPETAKRIINELEVAAGERTLVTDAAILERSQRIQQNADRLLGKGSPAIKMAELSRKLVVENVYETTLISVSLEGRDRQLIADLVNSVVDSYMLSYKGERKNWDARRGQGLGRQLNNVQGRLAQARNALQVFKDERGGVRMVGERTDITQRLILLQNARTQAQLDVIAMQLMKQQLEAMQDDVTATAEMELRIQTDPTLLGLRATETDLLSIREQRLTRFTIGHDEVKNLDSRLATTRAQMEARKAELTRTLIAQQKDAAENNLTTAQSRFDNIDAEYQRAYSLALQQEKDSIRYDQLMAEYQVLKDERDTIRDAITRAAITDDVSRSNVGIQAPAKVADAEARVGPRRHLYVPLSFLGGLLLSIGLALLVELIDNRVRTPLQVIRNVQLPVLGTVPDRREDPPTHEIENLPQVTVEAPQSLMAESFRQLRTALMYSTDTELKTLLVTSPRAGAGKTVVANNLAITLAQGGSRVLLIDANFRRSLVHRVFDLPNTVGLSSVLARLSSFDEAVQTTSVANLDALCCGPVPPSPGDLLGSEAMQNLLTEARGRYDSVILDGPPILIVSDAHVLCSMVDGAAMVVSCADTPRGVAIRGKRTLQTLKARVVGAVLNRIRATKGGYFREAYKSYYDYAGGTTQEET